MSWASTCTSATLVALTVSTKLAVMTLIVVLIVEQTVDSVIEPIVMGDAVRIHPLAILFALAIGGAIAGVLGMIAAIPIAAAAYTIYLYFARKYGMLACHVRTAPAASGRAAICGTYKRPQRDGGAPWM